MTAPADLAEVLAALDLVAQATHGPWRTFGRWPHLAVVSGSDRPRIVASLSSASNDVDDTPKDAAAIVALRNAAPAIAAAVEELTAARAEIAALNRQVCRLVSGQEIDGDRLCQHHGADVAALALLADERAAHAETLCDLDALLTALGAQVTPGGQTMDACHARRVADGMRLAKREVPADVAKHIVERDEPGLYATRYRNPHDGHLYVGPQIRASGRDEAERIASQLSYSGQPLTVDGLLVDEFPASLADPAARAEIKSAIAAEVQRVIDESADGKAGGGR